MNSKRFYTSLVLNILIFVLVVTGMIVSFTIGSGATLDHPIDIFKYFTVQSNVFMGVVAFTYAYYQLLIINKKKENIPHVLAIFNFIAVTEVTLTCFIVAIFLAPSAGLEKMYTKANLFFHLIVPVIAIFNHVFFIKESSIRFIETLFAIIPPLTYGIVYFIIVAANDAYGDLKIDIYNFGGNGPVIGALNFLAITVFAYTLGLLLYLGNTFVFKKRR